MPSIMRRALYFAVAAASLLGCPMPPTNAARMQEAAQDLNMNARFGRMEMAIESVEPKERDAFVKRHKSWGSGVRIADTELAGAHLKSDTEAEVTVRVAWYRPTEQELRVTSVKQRWKNLKDRGWTLVGEERLDGDPGLIGDPVPEGPAPAPHQDAHFPTIRLGARAATGTEPQAPTGTGE